MRAMSASSSNATSGIAMPIAPVEIQPANVQAVAEETVFGLSSFAKTVAAVFCAVIVTMLTMICINTQIINEKAASFITGIVIPVDGGFSAYSGV